MTKPEIIHPDDEKLMALLASKFHWFVGLYIGTVVLIILAIVGMFVYSEDIELEMTKVNAAYTAKYIAADLKERDARSKAWGR